MSNIQNDGPRLAHVERGCNKSYYPIRGLLEELDMKDKQEQDQFRSFLKEYLGWDENTKQGYTKQEHIALPDSHMPCYARQFLDKAAIQPEVRLAESRESMAGPYYFPGPLDVGPNFSPHVKKWNYAQHRDGLIEVVAAIMVTQKRNLRGDVQQSRTKGKRAGLTRPESSRKRRTAIRQQRATTFTMSDSDADSFSDVSNNARNASTASPPYEPVQRRASGSVSRPSTAFSATSTSRQPLAPRDSPTFDPPAAPSGTSPAQSPTPSTKAISASSQASTSFIQPITDARQNGGTDGSRHTNHSTSTLETDHAIHSSCRNLPTSPASSIMPMTSPTTASEAEIMRLISKIEGVQQARKLCMETHCSHQIAARSTDGPGKQQMVFRAAGVLDMLMKLDQALQQDEAELRRLVGA